MLGCDSSFIEIVDWIPSSHSFENYTLCQDSVLNIYNETITAAGNYLFLIENAETSCRDTISVSVEAVTINVNVSEQGNALLAEEVADGYAWLDCNTNETIPGANSQQFSPAVSGSYAVMISDEGCESTGICIDIEIVGLAEVSENEIEIYPNPAHDVCYIQSTRANIIQIELFDTTGKALKNGGVKSIGNSHFILSLQGIPSGVYSLVLTLSDHTTVLRKMTVY